MTDFEARGFGLIVGHDETVPPAPVASIFRLGGQTREMPPSAAAAQALVEVLTLLDSFPADVREWVLGQITVQEQFKSVHATGQELFNGQFTDLFNEPIRTVQTVQKGGDVRGGFLQFWSLYPRKQKKGLAYQYWLKLKPNQELQVRILRAVREQIHSEQWIKDNGQFIPLPSTWLKAGQWDDERTVLNSPMSTLMTSNTRRSLPAAEAFIKNMTERLQKEEAEQRGLTP